MSELKNNSFKIGEITFFRSVTHYHSGRVVEVTETDVLLEDAAWIADTGRFSNALEAMENLKEVEPFPGQVGVARGAIVDFCWPKWKELPTEQK